MKQKKCMITAIATLACFIGSMIPCVYAENSVSSNGLDTATTVVEADPQAVELATWHYETEKVPDVQYVQTDTSLMDGEVLMGDDFEDGLYNDTFAILGWGFGSTPRVDPAINENEAASGSKSLTLTGMPSGLNGIYFQQDMDFTGEDIYEISFKAKCSEDFSGKLHLSILMRWGQPNWWRQGFLPTNNNGFVPKSDEWTEFRAEIKESQLKDTDPARLNPHKTGSVSEIDIGRLFIAVDTDGLNGGRKGELYLDDIQIRKITEELEYPPKVTADDSLFWYNANNGVMPQIKLTPTYKVRPAKYPNVKGYFYDVHGNIADTITCTAEEFNNGITWTPPKAGYYDFEFALIDTAGVEHIWYEWYSCFNNEPKYYYKRSLVVTPRPTKPMEERRPGMGGTLSAKGYEDKHDDIEMWDKMGFSTLRLHSMTFGSGSAYRGDGREVVGKEKGVYDFSYYDELFRHAKEDYGFNDIEVTMSSIPDWANPTLKADGKVGNQHVPPLDDNVFVNQVRAAAKHFKGIVNYWELFNEPGMPGESIFWLTTPERYFSLHKKGYEAIKEEDPDAKVAYETPVGATFPVKQMELGLYDYIDTYHAHGQMGEGAGYTPESRNLFGDNPKPEECSNTEMHAVLRRARKGADSNYQLSLNEAQMAIVAIKSYLIVNKSELKRQILFGAVAGVGGDDLERAVYRMFAMNATPYDNAGVFRVRPVTVPRMCAMAIWQFVDGMGMDYKYINESKFDDIQNMVHVKNDGKDQLLMWLDFGTTESAKLSEDILKYASDDLKIYDFEFNEVDTSDRDNIVLEPDKLYYVEGINGDELEKTLPDGYGKSPASGAKDMRFGKVLYNYQFNGMGIDLDPNIKIPEANANKTKLFDPKTFELSDNINWIENDINWVQYATRGTFEKDIDAKFAVYIDSDRLQVVAKVYGDAEHRPMGDVSKLWWGDSIQIGLDAFGLSTTSGRIEILMGGKPGQEKIWKDFQPDDNALVNPDLTKTKKEMPSSHGSYKITFGPNDEGVNETTYYMEIPAYEIAPYAYPATDAEKKSTPLRFSLLINQNEHAKDLYLDTNQTHVRTGYLEWSTGIGGSKMPWYYGKIWIPASN